MPRGGKGVKIAKEPSTAQERNQAAVRRTDKDVSHTIFFEALEIS